MPVRFLLPLLVGCGAVQQGSEPIVEPDAATPVYGGTIATSVTGPILVADPGTDHVWGVERDLSAVRWEQELAPGSEPFRVEILDGTAWVTLRGSGEVAAFDTESGDLLATATVCAEPRGLDVDDASVVVACATGEVVTLDHGLDVTDRFLIDDDLRDVVIERGGLWVSRFRSAEVLYVDRRDGAVARRVTPQPADALDVPHVAWRMRGDPSGNGVVVLHQIATTEVVNPDEGQGYGSISCDEVGPVAPPVFTRVTASGSDTSGPVPVGVLHDFVFSPDGLQVPFTLRLAGPQTAWMTVPFAAVTEHRCEMPSSLSFTPIDGVVTSAGRVDSRSILLTREPTALHSSTASLELAPARAAVPFATFHQATRAGVACATCHPEGREDGHVWRFRTVGRRRTQSLSGGLRGRAPYHWDGEFSSMAALVDEVMVGRMGGDPPSAGVTRDLLSWIDRIPATQSHPLAGSALIQRGRALFEDRRVGCAGCHGGALYTDNLLHAVRSGEHALKTPSLVGVGSRAPFMHDGCAATLEERFTSPLCGGGDEHGVTSQLGQRDIDALVAYLRTL